MDLDGFFPYRLAVVSEAFSRRLTEVYREEFGLYREEWRLLFLLARSGPLSSVELSRRTTLDKVQVSRASSRLVEKGLITRAIPDGDKRLREYACTPAGHELFGMALPKVQARADETLAALAPEDREALLRGITALGEVLSAMPPADVEEALATEPMPTSQDN